VSKTFVLSSLKPQLSGNLMVSALDQRRLGRGFESSWPRAAVGQLLFAGLNQPSIFSGSVNEYRLRLGRFKAGMREAAWCAP